MSLLGLVPFYRAYYFIANLPLPLRNVEPATAEGTVYRYNDNENRAQGHKRTSNQPKAVKRQANCSGQPCEKRSIDFNKQMGCG